LLTARQFFTDRGFLEVETPVRLPAPALEDYIDAEPAGACYLRTSPELHMKRLLAAGYDRLFQIGPCFRRGELGRRHLPEFDLLEWYRAPGDYRDILSDTRELFVAWLDGLDLAPVVRVGAATVNLLAPWEELGVDEAFARYAQTSVDRAVAAGEFERLLAERVEPNLGQARPTVLLDYPVAFGGLARTRPDRPERAERWELYVAGVELANAYSELTDAAEQRRRFLECQELRRRQGRDVYPLDEPFLLALAHGMPPAGGIALGIDRTLMLFCGLNSVHDVVAFPPPCSTAG